MEPVAQILVFTVQMFGPSGSYPVPGAEKCGQNYRKFQNLLEVKLIG